MGKNKRSDESTAKRVRKAQNVTHRRPRKGETHMSDELIHERLDEAKRNRLATIIYDRNGELAPTVAATEIRRHPGRLWKLIDRRGAVGISQDGETIAVGLSLNQFALILLGFRPRPRREKRKTRKKARGKR